MRYKLQLIISLLLLPFIPLIVGKWYDFALFIGTNDAESFFSCLFFCIVIAVTYIANTAFCMEEITHTNKE